MTRLSLQSTVQLNSGHEIPVLGLGVYRNVDECLSACKTAVNNGYRHIDTAVMYRNQKLVGKALKESGVRRDDVFITTKVPSRFHGYERTSEKIDESLKELGVDYIDLYLINDPLSSHQKRIDTWRALSDAKTQGKIRSIGVSNYGIKHLEEIEAAGLETPSVNQLELHPVCQQRPIASHCREKGIVVEAYCPLLRGNFELSGLQEIASKHQKEPAQVLLRWSIQKGYVPVPKSAREERIVSNSQIFDFELSGQEMDQLDSLDEGAKGALLWNPVNAG